MKVLVTGSHGFIGKNLVSHLKGLNISIVEFNRFDKLDLNGIDFIFHLAGSNRPKDNEEYYKDNTDLTQLIIDEINKNNLDIPILYTSSTQVNLDNDYGKSKLKAENIIREYGKNHKIYIYRLTNVFGKWSKPNYNSVIATFCYNISHNKDIIIDDKNKLLNLIYIDDVIKDFIKAMNNKLKEKDIYDIHPIYTKSLGYIAKTIKSFKNELYVPKTYDKFIKKLYSTYISYIDLDNLVINPIMNIDDRGSFTELIKTNEIGQISVSYSKKGITRGNHYHHTKIERFIVLKGIAKITLKHIITNEIKEYIVDSKELKIVNIPVGYTHKIENISNEEMVLLIWCNENFDKKNPDTYYMEA